MTFLQAVFSAVIQQETRTGPSRHLHLYHHPHSQRPPTGSLNPPCQEGKGRCEKEAEDGIQIGINVETCPTYVTFKNNFTRMYSFVSS